MNKNNLSKIIKPFVLILCIGILIYSCSKSTSTTVTPPATCINVHKTIYDSICNIAGTRPSKEHHIHYEYDSGKLVKHTVLDTFGINFTVTVSGSKIVSYANYAYTMIDSSTTRFQFANYNLPNGDHAYIFYYPQKDSFVVTSLSTTYLNQITRVDVDTLFTYW